MRQCCHRRLRAWAMLWCGLGLRAACVTPQQPAAADVLVLAPLPIEMRWAVTGCYARTRGVRCRVVETGVGKVNAAYAATRAILEQRPLCVVQFGTAGWLREPMPPGALAQVARACQWDYGWFDAGTFVPQQINGPRALQRPRDGWRGSPYLQQIALRTAASLTNRTMQFWHAGALRAVAVTCVVADVVTGDTFVSDMSERAAIAARTGAHIMDMETAATAEVCARMGVPFVALRAVTHTPAANPVLDFRQTSNQMLCHLSYWLAMILDTVDTNILAIEASLPRVMHVGSGRQLAHVYDAERDACHNARLLFDKGDFAAAATLLAQHVQREPIAAWRCYRLLALSYDYLARPEQAARVLRAAREHAYAVDTNELARELYLHQTETPAGHVLH